MKSLVILLALASVAWAAALTDEDTYTDKYDAIDVQQIITNERLLKNYINCLMEADEKGCTREGKVLKKVLPEALENECKKCTAKQKKDSEMVIRYLVNDRQEIWTRLAAKYDPEGKYRSRYVDEARSRGINL